MSNTSGLLYTGDFVHVHISSPQMGHENVDWQHDECLSLIIIHQESRRKEQHGGLARCAVVAEDVLKVAQKTTTALLVFAATVRPTLLCCQRYGALKLSFYQSTWSKREHLQLPPSRCSVWRQFQNHCSEDLPRMIRHVANHSDFIFLSVVIVA